MAQAVSPAGSFTGGRRVTAPSAKLVDEASPLMDLQRGVTREESIRQTEKVRAAGAGSGCGQRVRAAGAGASGHAGQSCARAGSVPTERETGAELAGRRRGRDVAGRAGWVVLMRVRACFLWRRADAAWVASPSQLGAPRVGDGSVQGGSRDEGRLSRAQSRGSRSGLSGFTEMRMLSASHPR
jgi:hypothetical protein